MIQYKICMLGAFAAGKTSLVNMFAHGLFSERYHTTVGVRVEKKQLEIAAQDGNRGTSVDLIIWDLHGEDEFQKLRTAYLRGASGIMLVVDSTRRETVDVAIELLSRVGDYLGPVPAVLLINKTDLDDQREINAPERARLATLGIEMVDTSARTGTAVDQAFQTITQLIVAHP